MRRILVMAVFAVAIPAVTIGLNRLKPAAPGVEMAALWPDTVKRGPMVRDLRGLGTLVPEETLLIPAPNDGRVQRVLIRPGASVRPDSVVMVLTNPELQLSLQTAEFELKTAEADYENLEAMLEKARIDLQVQTAQLEANYKVAKLEADRDQALAAKLTAQISTERATELESQVQLQQQRIAVNSRSDEAQLAAQRVKIEQLRAQYELKKSQVDQLRVRAGAGGTLQQLPAPVEEGQKVTAGTPLGRVAQPSRLKAEIKIAETQFKDIVVGQRASIDTRNGIIAGHVSRIDPSILNGTVTVDVALEGALPPGARPDLSVDGTIELERLADVVYVGRPVFGQENASAQLFKLDTDGKNAQKVRVTFGRASVNTIEVKDGLRVGDRVILSDMSAYDSYDRIQLN